MEGSSLLKIVVVRQLIARGNMLRSKQRHAWPIVDYPLLHATVGLA